MFAQVTNTVVELAPGLSQSDVSTLSVAAISLTTPVVVWLLAKLLTDPKTDKLRIHPGVLPVITPVVGLGIGYVMNKLGTHLSAGDMAQAGAVAVCVRESVNQWVTKRMQKSKDQPELDLK